jgi:hypothetical protein
MTAEQFDQLMAHREKIFGLNNYTPTVFYPAINTFKG